MADGDGGKIVTHERVISGGVVTHIQLSEEQCLKLLTAAVEETQPLELIERLYVFYVMARMKNNKCHASEKLGIDRRTIQRWMRDA